MQNSQKTMNFAFCLECKILTGKNASQKNNRGRVGAAHFVVAFLKSYPKPKAGPYDIRTIVFERQTFRSTKSQHETLLSKVRN